MWEKYLKNPKCDGCLFCNKAKPFSEDKSLWYVTDNDFYYDEVCVQHKLLVPKRHVGNIWELTGEELRELVEMFKHYNYHSNYDTSMLNFAKAQSIKNHLHFHLCEWKRR